MALDVMGYSLHYYTNDYTPVVSTNGAFVATQTSSDLVNTGYSKDMYNGNIARMVTTITNPNTRAVLPLGNAYKYDQLNRLSTALSFTNLNTSANTWGSGGTGIYANNFTYDANGNILTQLRKNESAAIIDSLRYFYQQNSAGKIVRNRLYHVHDATSAGTYSDDIDDMGTYSGGGTINIANNYVYDESGRLIKDVQSGILQITWTVDNKVKEIKRSGGGGTNMRFDYDALGRRVAKHTYTDNFTSLIKSTYYILDAGGKVMSTYERVINSPSVYFTQREKFIYGSDRIGVMNDSIALLGSQNATYSQATWNHVIGKLSYELVNQLGNVLSVISDKPIPHTSGSVTDFFLADIRQATDYSAFGVELSGRSFIVSGAKDFRYGFNGMEQDDEIKGEGNSYTTEFRQFDPRLGRWLSTDPLTTSFPSQSPYCAFDNRPLVTTDPSGMGPGDGIDWFGFNAIALATLASTWKEYIGEPVIINHVMSPTDKYLAACRRIDKDKSLSWLGKWRARNKAMSALFEATGSPKTAKVNQIIGGVSLAIVGKVQDILVASTFVHLLKKTDDSAVEEVSAIAKKNNISMVRAYAVHKVIQYANQVKQMDTQDYAEVGTNAAIDVGLALAGEGLAGEGLAGEAATGAMETENIVNIGTVEDDVMMFSAKIGDETVEGISNFTVRDGKLYLDQMHLQGSSAGKIGRQSLWNIAKDLGRQYNVEEVIIQGGKRTTGKYKGQVPSPVSIKI